MSDTETRLIRDALEAMAEMLHGQPKIIAAHLAHEAALMALLRTHPRPQTLRSELAVQVDQYRPSVETEHYDSVAAMLLEQIPG